DRIGGLAGRDANLHRRPCEPQSCRYVVKILEAIGTARLICRADSQEANFTRGEKMNPAQCRLRARPAIQRHQDAVEASHAAWLFPSGGLRTRITGNGASRTSFSAMLPSVHRDAPCPWEVITSTSFGPQAPMMVVAAGPARTSQETCRPWRIRLAPTASTSWRATLSASACA